MSERGHFEAYASLFHAYEGITPANGFKIDLGGRVYSSLIPPTAGPKITMPYACLPVVTSGDGPELENYFAADILRIEATIYLAQNEKNSLAAARTILWAYEDMVRVIMPSPTQRPPRWDLGNLGVEDVAIAGKTLIGRDTDKLSWAEVSVLYEMKIRFSRAEIAPGS